MRNYSKNVKDLYMPMGGRNKSKSVRGGGDNYSDNEAAISQTLEERKNYIGSELDSGITV